MHHLVSLSSQTAQVENEFGATAFFNSQALCLDGNELDEPKYVLFNREFQTYTPLPDHFNACCICLMPVLPGDSLANRTFEFAHFCATRIGLSVYWAVSSFEKAAPVVHTGENAHTTTWMRQAVKRCDSHFYDIGLPSVTIRKSAVGFGVQENGVVDSWERCLDKLSISTAGAVALLVCWCQPSTQAGGLGGGNGPRVLNLLHAFLFRAMTKVILPHNNYWVQCEVSDETLERNDHRGVWALAPVLGLVS